MDEEKNKLHNNQDPHLELASDEIEVGAALKWTGGLTACVLVVMIVSRLIVMAYLKNVDPESRVGIRQFYAPEALKHFPAPQLQLAEADEYKKFNESQNSILSSYGWVDKDAQKVRVPIHRAMDMLLQAGLPAARGDGE
jgi:hypothetical protein